MNSCYLALLNDSELSWKRDSSLRLIGVEGLSVRTSCFERRVSLVFID